MSVQFYCFWDLTVFAFYDEAKKTLKLTSISDQPFYLWNDQPINIKTIIRPIGGRQDQPWLMEDDDGKQYVVKFRRNDDRPTIMNEIFANKLAVQLNLPVPKMFLVDVDIQLINRIPRLRKRRIDGGCHIATEYVENSITMNDLPQNSANSLKILNIDQVPEFIVFDMMLYNADRHKGNILLSKNSDNRYKYHLIDHGNIFFGQLWKKPLCNLHYASLQNEWKTNGTNDPKKYRDFIKRVSDLKESDYWNSANYIVNEFLLPMQDPKFVVNKLTGDDQGKIFIFINKIKRR